MVRATSITGAARDEGNSRDASTFDVLTSRSLRAKFRSMRTTLTIDDDLAGLLKQRAREMGVPFKEAVNRTIRAGLGEAAKPRRGTAPKTVPHSFGFRPGVDLDKLGQLADELEAEAFTTTVERSRDPARRQRSRSRT
jgi:hypothetical protein